MGLAIAETLAAEGARVAVMARERSGLDAAVALLRTAGAPDAVGISVDMADADSITAGFAVVAERWGELNSLVHTIRPATGTSRKWTTPSGKPLSGWDDVGGTVHTRGIATAAGRAVGQDRDAVGALDSAPEPTDRRLHGVEGSPEQHHQEPLQKSCG